MKRPQYHIRFTPETETLYIAEGEGGYRWTLLQGERAKKIHDMLREELENPAWADSQQAEEQSEINANTARAARLFEKPTR